MQVRILHQRAGVVVVDKPPTLESTGRTVDDPRGLQSHLQAQLGRKVWLVHQLDRETSGALVFVTRKSLVSVWQDALRGGTKRYLACVHGTFAWERRTLDSNLAYDPSARGWKVAAEGKPAWTELTRLAANERASLLEARIRTGRTHQIRVHLAHLGFPLLGERKYREPASTAHPRHALHAWRIETAKATFEAPPPDDFLRLADRFELGEAARALPASIEG